MTFTSRRLLAATLALSALEISAFRGPVRVPVVDAECPPKDPPVPSRHDMDRIRRAEERRVRRAARRQPNDTLCRPADSEAGAQKGQSK